MERPSMFGGSSCCSYGNKRLVIKGGRGGNVCKARMGFGCIVCRGLPLVLKAMNKMKKNFCTLNWKSNNSETFQKNLLIIRPSSRARYRPSRYATTSNILNTHQTQLATPDLTRTLALGKFGYTRRDLGFTSRADLTSLTRIVNTTVLVWPSLNFSHDRVHSSLIYLEFGPSLTHIDDITSGSVIKLITVAHNIYY